MNATIVSNFVGGRESQHVVCDCGWVSAKLWADKSADVIAYWAEGEAASHHGEVTARSRRAVEAERARLRGEVARLETQLETVRASLTSISSGL